MENLTSSENQVEPNQLEKPQSDLEENTMGSESNTEIPKKKIKLNESEDEDNETDKKKSTAGVIYLSRIPTKMNVKLIRDYFSTFGEVDRIYLEPKELKHKKQQRSFEEGWVEFKKRRIAKKVATKLNNMQVGGKRRNPWFHELWNIKYLKNFRWTHLNERLAYEQESRKQRLRQEVALAKKEANFYIQNVEKNEKRKRFEKKQVKEGEANTESQNESQQIYKKSDSNQNDEDEPFKHKNKHPVFERKVKVAGNDTFLKQIFS